MLPQINRLELSWIKMMPIDKVGHSLLIPSYRVLKPVKYKNFQAAFINKGCLKDSKLYKSTGPQKPVQSHSPHALPF